MCSCKIASLFPVACGHGEMMWDNGFAVSNLSPQAELHRMLETQAESEQAFEKRDKDLREEMTQLATQLNSVKVAMGDTLHSAELARAAEARAQQETLAVKVRSGCCIKKSLEVIYTRGCRDVWGRRKDRATVTPGGLSSAKGYQSHTYS